MKEELTLAQSGHRRRSSDDLSKTFRSTENGDEATLAAVAHHAGVAHRL
jgi:hypothetical protein